MNEITLVHPFKDKCPNIEALLKKQDGTLVTSIESFCARIKEQSLTHNTLIDENDYKGWALELFVEFMIKVDGADNRIGIYNYEPVTEEDVGVDGHGLGENQEPATVQVKYRTGDYVLTANADHLSNFLTASIFNFQVPIESNKNMLIVTTGNKVDEQTREKMLKGVVRVLNRDALREMFDNRPEFWTRFYESVIKSQIKKEIIVPIRLRKHQQEGMDLVKKDPNQKGQIILPTGCGKTILESEIIREKILECQAKGIVPVIKVNASRILLCFQLFEEVFRYLNSYGIEARYVNFNSGNADEKYYAKELRKAGGVFREIVSSTSPKSAIDAYEKAKQEKVPFIVFSTYHSSENFAKTNIVPNLTIHDEAHNLVSREFHKAATLPSESSFFFTATMRTTESDQDLGMNNLDIFDEIIFKKSAKEMIDAGEMVQPRIHIVKGFGSKIDAEKTDTDYESLFSSIKSAFLMHSKQVKIDSYDASKIGAKILVVCRGQQDLIEIFKTKGYEDFRVTNPSVHIFALSSEFGLRNDDEYFKPPVTNVKKYKMLQKLKSLKAEEECLVFHVDMIGEGIDVPGITGVMPFRNCEMGKFVQNIGRAARLHSEDRKRFYKGEINPNDLSKYIKPNSWVIIPTFLINSEGFADRFKGIIQELRSEYGIIKEQVLISNDNGLSEEEDIDKVNDIDKKKRHSNSGIEGFEHDIEEKSLLERVIFDEEVGNRKNEIINELSELLK